VTFAKVLTIYPIRIHPSIILLYLPPPIFGIVSTGFVFFIFFIFLLYYYKYVMLFFFLNNRCLSVTLWPLSHIWWRLFCVTGLMVLRRAGKCAFMLFFLMRKISMTIFYFKTLCSDSSLSPISNFKVVSPGHLLVTETRVLGSIFMPSVFACP
jgi:hypothetical protein